VNQRSDEWGGSLENRARLLLDVVCAIRSAVTSSFAVAVKLNSADFQRGGFDAQDAARVIAMLEPLGVDLVELSGGSYESPAMSGRPADGRTAAREAYFLELAAQLSKTTPLPLMLTGGITRRETAEQVLASGVALVGIASAMAITPDLCSRWQEGSEATEQLRPVTWSDKTLASAAGMALARHQMRRVTRGRQPTGKTHPLHALVCDQRVQRRALGRYRAWLETRA
jgi:2,4-dienoyl-CoA reductase-like NADH-dependent reductase (Old Yellow Enzyme family)